MKKWFFDLGSTLLDESDCTEYRILDMFSHKPDIIVEHIGEIVDYL